MELIGSNFANYSAENSVSENSLKQFSILEHTELKAVNLKTTNRFCVVIGFYSYVRYSMDLLTILTLNTAQEIL